MPAAGSYPCGRHICRCAGPGSILCAGARIIFIIGEESPNPSIFILGDTSPPDPLAIIIGNPGSQTLLLPCGAEVVSTCGAGVTCILRSFCMCASAGPGAKTYACGRLVVCCSRAGATSYACSRLVSCCLLSRGLAFFWDHFGCQLILGGHPPKPPVMPAAG